MARHKELLNVFINLIKTESMLVKYLNRSLSGYNLNMTDFSVIDLLFQKGEQTIQKIAEKIMITSGSITYVVNKLERMELISRRKDVNDSRISHIKLTPYGKEVLISILPLQMEKIREIFSELTENDLTLLNNILKKINIPMTE